MYYWLTLLLAACVLLKVARDRRRMGCAAAVYVIILVIDVIVGTAIVAWKCKFLDDEEECQLAIGGTLGSVAMWLVLLFILPHCFVRFDFYPARRHISDAVESARNRLTYSQSEQLHSNIQTALSLSGTASSKDGQLISNTHLQPIKEVSISAPSSLVEVIMENERTPLLSDTCKITPGYAETE